MGVEGRFGKSAEETASEEEGWIRWGRKEQTSRKQQGRGISATPSFILPTPHSATAPPTSSIITHPSPHPTTTTTTIPPPRCRSLPSANQTSHGTSSQSVSSLPPSLHTTSTTHLTPPPQNVSNAPMPVESPVVPAAVPLVTPTRQLRRVLLTQTLGVF